MPVADGVDDGTSTTVAVGVTVAVGGSVGVAVAVGMGVGNTQIPSSASHFRPGMSTPSRRSQAALV
ncbi:MAG: hypothetical protein KGZ30_01295 [Anaplasmataceae bacterium]|nr:hypothetical protein [Anaplasmataceae bacterium]